MHDEHKPLISRFPCYVEAEGRSEEREGIRHATCLGARILFAGRIGIDARIIARLFPGDSLFRSHHWTVPTTPY